MADTSKPIIATGAFAEAESLEKAGMYHSALPFFAAAVATNLHNLDMHHALARNLQEIGDTVAAAEAYRKLIEVVLREPNEVVDQGPDLYLLWALEFFRDSDLVSDAKQTAELILQSPEDEDTFGFPPPRLNALMCLKRYAELEDLCRRATKHMPSDALDLRGFTKFLILSLIATERFSTAEAELARAGELAGLASKLCGLRALCAFQSGRFAEALSFLGGSPGGSLGSLTDWGLFEGTPVGDGELLKACCFSELADFDSAIETLQGIVDSSRVLERDGRRWVVAEAFFMLGQHHSWMSNTRLAEAFFREAIRIEEQVRYLAELSEVLERDGCVSEALDALEKAVKLEPNHTAYLTRLAKLQQDPFERFLSDGEHWLAQTQWSSPVSSPVLRACHERGCEWSDPDEYLDDLDFDVTWLEETLARAESLRSNLILQPELPIYLNLPNSIEIALNIENGLLCAWVAAGYGGVSVTIDINNFDLHYGADSSYARFAAGAALNWFLDCSMSVHLKPQFRRFGTWEPENSIAGVRSTISQPIPRWTATDRFHSDVDNLRSRRIPQPPRAHRVRGHIRTLSRGEPSDQSRNNAPSYIRNLMGPRDAWVRAHERGGSVATEQLITHLSGHSSLADYIATVPKPSYLT